MRGGCFSCFSRRPKHLELLDVFVRHDAVLLVYPRFDASLRNICKQRTFVELEVKLVMRSLLHACAHLHMHGLVHTDVKPQNVLVKGVGLSQCRSGCISCYPNWSDADACLQFSKDVDNLPSLLEVVLGDLGLPLKIKKTFIQTLYRPFKGLYRESPFILLLGVTPDL